MLITSDRSYYRDSPTMNMPTPISEIPTVNMTFLGIYWRYRGAIKDIRPLVEAIIMALVQYGS